MTLQVDVVVPPHVFCQMNNHFLIKQSNSTGSHSNCLFYPVALGSLHI